MDRDRVLNRFLDYVRTDSVPTLEGPMFRAITQELDAAGIPWETDDAGDAVGGEVGNIIAHLPGTAEAAAIMFNAHMDTVAQGIGVQPDIQDGIVLAHDSAILGADDKAAVAALMEAALLFQSGQHAYPPTDMVFTICEEIGLLGAAHLDRSTVRARLGFVLDSTGPVGGIVTGAPSHDQIQIVMHGTAAHAGANPQDGVNAIALAAQAIARLPWGRLDEETTANVGIIRGGDAGNVVPARVEIRAEARSHDHTKLEQVVRDVCQAFEQAAQAGGGHVEVEVKRAYEAYRLTEEDAPVRIARAAARHIGREPRLGLTGGGSDASIFNATGLSIVVVSVGYEHPHTPQERIRVDDLYALVDYTLAIAEEATRS